MTTATAINVIHALHEWTEPSSIRIYPFLPHDIVQSITELALINQRDVWYDKRNRERDMEICALRAEYKARDFCPIETPGRLSAPIFVWAREDAVTWNRHTNSWVLQQHQQRELMPPYGNEWQFPYHDGGFSEINRNVRNMTAERAEWSYWYGQGSRVRLTTEVQRHMHRAFIMAEFNDDIYAD